MEKEKKIKLLHFNTVEETNMALLQVITSGNSKKLFELVKLQHYPISAFVLNLMLDFGMEKQIPTLVKVANHYRNDIYDWLLEYWGREKTDDLIYEAGYSDLIDEKVSNECLIKHQDWKRLNVRGCLDVLVDNQQFELLYKRTQTACKVFEEHNNLSELPMKLDCLSVDFIAQKKDVKLLMHKLAQYSDLVGEKTYGECLSEFWKLYRQNPEVIDKCQYFPRFRNLNILRAFIHGGIYSISNAYKQYKLMISEGAAEHIDVLRMCLPDNADIRTPNIEMYEMTEMTRKEVADRGKKLVKALIDADEWKVISKNKKNFLYLDCLSLSERFKLWWKERFSSL